MNSIQLLVSGALVLGLTSQLPAQEKAGSDCCEAQSKTGCCEIQVAKDGGQKEQALVAFEKLAPEQQKEVAQALIRMSGTCPYGSRFSKTIVALDKLYTDSIQSLNGLANHENCNATLKADLQKELVKLNKLKAVNDHALAMMREVTAPAMAGCSATAKAEAKSDCGGCEGEKAEDCGGCDSGKAEVAEAKAGACGGCDEGARVTKLVDGAKALAASWKDAKAEAMKLEPAKQEQLASDMALVKKYGTDKVLSSVIGAVIKQAEMGLDACKGVACPKEGIMARHADLMENCSFTKGICESSVSELRAAYALLQASTADFRKAGKKASGKAEACETEGGCEGAKTDCDEVKVKG